MRDVTRLVLDANIMVSALLGTSFSLLLRLFEQGVLLMAPVHQIAETRDVLLRRKELSSDWIDDQMTRLGELIVPLHPALLQDHEATARRRLGDRGQPDWPLLAGHYATGAGIWSRDKDLFGSGAPIWSTRVLKRELELVNG